MNLQNLVIVALAATALLYFRPINNHSESLNVEQLILGGQHVITSNHRNAFVGGSSIATIEAQKLLDQSLHNKTRDVIARGERTSRSEIENEIYQRAVKEWSVEDAEALVWIVKRESSFNPSARNVNCLGLFQRNYPNFTSEERESYLQDVQGQIDDGFNYIKSRYGSPIKGKEFWERSGWY